MSSSVLLFLIQTLVVVAAPYAIWRWGAVRAVAPLVVVQILLGIALGPSLLGRFAPDLWQSLFPAPSLPSLKGLVWLSLLFFAFLSGLHFDLAELRGNGRAFAATSLSSILVPVCLGTVAGWLIAGWLPSALGPVGSPLIFACGMGISAGVTALPVLSAILRELGMMAHPTGRLALGAAAVNDIALWVLAAVLLSQVHAQGFAQGWIMLAGLVAFGLLLWLVIRPMLKKLLAHAEAGGGVNQRELVAVCSLLLLSAIATEALGVHAMIGAFAFGAVMPRSAAADLVARFESFVVIVLLPFFFISTGLATRLDPAGEGVGLIIGVMALVAITGKMVGAGLPFYLLGGQGLRPALVVGAFMQCKGLMEIVVLTMLKDGGVISDSCFSAMIVVALITTALTKPLVRLWR